MKPLLFLLAFLPFLQTKADPVALGSRRELFVDRLLIDQLDQATLKMHAPSPVSVACSMGIDRPVARLRQS